MKTKSLLLVFMLVVIVPLYKIQAQAYLYGPVTLPVTHDELQSKNAMMAILTGTGSGYGTETMTGLGVNNNNPKYMIDALCDPTVVTPGPTNMDINISCPNCNPANSVGYRIGGQMVLWNEGNASDIYVGVNSGNSGGGANCTAIGYNTLTNNTAAANTAVGYYALYTNAGGGGGNTAVGAGALTANTTAQFNTALGWGALNANTAVGYNALFSKYFNTFIS